MKKLLTLLVAIASFLTVSASAQEVTANVGYQSKQIEFGQVIDSKGSFNVGANVAAYNFDLGLNAKNYVSNLKDEVARIDVLADYAFTAPIADLKVGMDLAYLRHPALNDVKYHPRPFVYFGKDFLNVVANYDTKSELANIEVNASKTFPLYGNLGLKPGVFVGYTDLSNELPKSVNSIQYKNAYLGGSMSLVFKGLSVGAEALHNGKLNANTLAWNAGYSLKF